MLQRFRDGKTLCLVATDVAARGLDIPNVDLVVHYELPNVRLTPRPGSAAFCTLVLPVLSVGHAFASGRCHIIHQSPG